MPAVRQLFLCTLVLLGIQTNSTHGEDVIVQRGGGPNLTGRILSINDDGIRIDRTRATGNPLITTISWDRVREVQSDVREMRLESYLPEVAEPLWRSRVRLERGDYVLAEPGFERLFARYLGQTSETALVVAEGLLRCRIARFAHDTAVLPMLEVIRLRRSDVTTSTFAGLAPVFDSDLELCPLIPPVWGHARGLRRLERQLTQYDAGNDEILAQLASFYLHAVRREMDVEETLESRETLGHTGLAMLLRYFDATDHRPHIREQARRSLERATETLPQWTHHWVDFTIGSSLILEETLDHRLEGLVRLSSLPAAKNHNQHYLAGLALYRMKTALESMGNIDGAAAMQAVLTERYPAHPMNNLAGLTFRSVLIVAGKLNA